MVKPNLSVGDTVLYSKYAGVEFEVSLTRDHLHLQCPLSMPFSAVTMQMRISTWYWMQMGMLRMQGDNDTQYIVVKDSDILASIA